MGGFNGPDLHERGCVMARPRLEPEGRRKQIAVRFGPMALRALEMAAERSGLSIGKEVERRAMESIAKELMGK